MGSSYTLLILIIFNGINFLLIIKMLEDPKPYYVLLFIVLIFIFLWFFIGGKECEFIGLKPLNPDHILSYADSYYSPKKFKKHLKTESNTSSDQSKKDIIETNDFNDKDDKICIDTTPELPPEFTRQTCVVNNDKFLSRGEKICRDTMEKIYGVPFKNTRPSWLKNDTTGRNLELDCYNEKLKMAVEYQGIFHTKFPNFFHKTLNEFKEVQRRDKLKIKICKQEGVHLIVVPHNVPFDLIPTYIMYHLPEVVKQRMKHEKII
jgi:hypothetical protein